MLALCAGKPIGNGYPLAGLVTSRAVAEQFAAGGMEFFATFGGSTAAAAAGAVRGGAGRGAACDMAAQCAALEGRFTKSRPRLGRALVER